MDITPNVEQLFITFQAFVADESQAFQEARVDHMMDLEVEHGRYYVLAERYDVLRTYQAR